MDKKVVYRKRSKEIGLIVVSWLLTIICLVIGNIFGMIFFGIGALLFTFRNFNPKTKTIYFGTPEYKEHIKAEFEKLNNDDGAFTYNEEGFNAKLKNASHDIRWADIRTMFGYKRDDMTTDTICLDVFCDNHIGFHITEETVGWYRFLAKSKEVFPKIEKNWDAKIAFPAFKTNLTVVYDYQGRSLEQVQNIYYKDK